MANKFDQVAARCEQMWEHICAAAVQARKDEQGGIEKVIAIAIVVGITVGALAIIGAVVTNWANSIPGP